MNRGRAALVLLWMVLVTSCAAAATSTPQPTASTVPSTVAPTTATTTTPSTTAPPTTEAPPPLIYPVRLIVPGLIDTPVVQVSRDTVTDCGGGVTVKANFPCKGQVDQLVSPTFPSTPCYGGASSIVGHTAEMFDHLVDDLADDPNEHALYDFGLQEDQEVWALLDDGTLCVGYVFRLPNDAPGLQFPGNPVPPARYMEKLEFVSDPEGDGNEFAKLVSPEESITFLQTSTCADFCSSPEGFNPKETPGDENGGRRYVAIVAVRWERRLSADAALTLLS